MPQYDLSEIIGSIMSHISFNLIDSAHAQAAGGAGGFDFMGLAPLVVIFIAFYFFLIRPQQKKAQQQREMLAAVAKNDRVVTAGGIIGRVHSLENDVEVVIEVEDGVRIRILKSAIVEKIPSGSTVKSTMSVVSGDSEPVAKAKPKRQVSAKKTSKAKTDK
jgi:preprotein translocase subunit YajC